MRVFSEKRIWDAKEKWPQAASALEQDSQRMESRPLTDRVPAAEKSVVKREAAR